MVVFFMESKANVESLEDAMDWLIDQAARFGMTGPEAIENGYAAFFDR